MYKQRDKYFTTNLENLVNRILSHNGYFTPYEFMSLRYACCQMISELNFKNSTTASYSENRKNKLKVKDYQRCINHLDHWFRHRSY